jgi:hypothetical protein
MNQDFAQLYSELGLRPGCSLVELKRAYRRRVAEQHPDRVGDRVGPAPSVSKNLALPELIALYSAAIQFHRQYGRLPGGQHARVSGGVPVMRASARRTQPPAAHSAHEDEPKLPFARTLIIAILLIALLLLLQTSWDRLASNVGDEFTRTPAGIVPGSVQTAARTGDPDARSTAAAEQAPLLGEITKPTIEKATAPAKADAAKPRRDANTP